jgi:hypothetical protein
MTYDLKLFVAYAHEDRETVRALIGALEQRNWKVYWDEELAAGQPGWQTLLDNELNAAFGILVVWSKHSAESDAVIREARVAQARDRLYGISIDGTDIPPEFADRWNVDLRGWTGDPNDPRIGKILEWPDELAIFHKGSDRRFTILRPLVLKKPGPGELDT